MTIGECKKTALALLDELSGDAAPYTDDDGAAARIPYLMTLGCRMLAAIQGQTKKTVLTSTEDGAVFNMPSDFFRLVRIEGGACEFSPDAKLTLPKAGSRTVWYDAIPAAITAATPDGDALPLSEEAASALPYFIAAQLMLADGDAGWVNWQSRFDSAVSALTEGRRRRGAHVAEGFRC